MPTDPHPVSEAESELTSLRGELATLLGPRLPRRGVTPNEQWIAAVAAVLHRAEAAEEKLRQERAGRVRFRKALVQLQMGPDTLTQNGLQIVLRALYPGSLPATPEEQS